MRNIKFRGISLKTNQWVYGSYVADEEWAKYYIYQKEHVGAYFQLVKHGVIPETVGQFTEMLDENDKELSAGDKGNFLLKGLGEGPAEVRYFDGGFWLVVEGQSQPLPLHEYEYRADITFTITGTIHDHLLKP